MIRCPSGPTNQEMLERDEFLVEIRDRLEQAQQFAKQQYDKTHRLVVFKVGDWVWLRLLHRPMASLGAPLCRRNLGPRYFGPYQVLTQVGSVAYHLQLPPGAKVHDVFHVGLLKKFVGTPPALPPALPPVHHGRVCVEPERCCRAG